MLVPLQYWQPRNENLGTEVTAPPGAITETPRVPSVVGPRELQENAFAGNLSGCENSLLTNSSDK